MSCFDDPAVAARPTDDSAGEPKPARITRYEIVEAIFQACKKYPGGLTFKKLAAETGWTESACSRRLTTAFNDLYLSRKEDVRSRTNITVVYRYRWRKQ